MMILHGSMNGGIENVNTDAADFEFKMPEYDDWGNLKANHIYKTCVVNNASLACNLIMHTENFSEMYIKGHQVTPAAIIVEEVFIPKTFQLFKAK